MASRVAQMESRLNSADTNISRLELKHKGDSMTNLMNNTESLVAIGQQNEAINQLLNDMRELKAGKLPSGSTSKTPVRLPEPAARTEQTKDGVPLSVYNQIRATAAQLWPGNSSMQDIEIKKELEAYRKLQP